MTAAISAAFAVRDWFAWSPDKESRAAWLAWVGGPPCEEPKTSPTVPSALRRRVTNLGQMALAAAIECGDATQAHYVFASRNGEYERTVNMFQSLGRGEQPSPAEFSMSVHHALAGLLSVHAGNKAGHTAIAAGLDSFGFGFVEAIAHLVESAAMHVLLLYYDEPLPHPYERFNQEAEGALPFILGLSLSATTDRHCLRFSMKPSCGVTPSESVPRDFLRFLLSNDGSAESVGERMIWCWHRDA